MDFEFLIPIGVCVVLPIVIVWLSLRAKQNETHKKAEIMLKAMENGTPLDPDYFKSPSKQKSIKQDLLEKLTGACITSLMGAMFLVIFFLGLFKGMPFNQFAPLAGGVMLAVGIALFISYFVGKNMLAKEIEAEEKRLGQE